MTWDPLVPLRLELTRINRDKFHPVQLTRTQAEELLALVESLRKELNEKNNLLLNGGLNAETAYR